MSSTGGLFSVCGEDLRANDHSFSKVKTGKGGERENGGVGGGRGGKMKTLKKKAMHKRSGVEVARGLQASAMWDSARVGKISKRGNLGLTKRRARIT